MLFDCVVTLLVTNIGVLFCLSRFPNIACELLTSDVALINDKLGGDESLLEKLYHFLEQEAPLNPLLASFFSKTIGNLIARKTDQVHTPDPHNSEYEHTTWHKENMGVICLICLVSKLSVIAHAGNLFPKEKTQLYQSGAESH